MNKQDKKFEQLMKGMTIDSPSKDFTLKVMERIQAEAVLLKQKSAVLEDYQPVISRKVWIILITAFISLILYIVFTGLDASQASEPGVLTAFKDSLQSVNTKGFSNFWQSSIGLFTSIPTVAYLIILVSMGLWTLDLFLSRLRHSTSDIQMN